MKPNLCQDNDQPVEFESACAGYNSANWSNVTQIVAVGDLNNDRNPELLATETDGAGHTNLWLLHSGGYRTFTDPVMIGRGGWLPMRLMAPGTTTPGAARPELWAADANGVIWQYPILATTGTVDDDPATRPTALGHRFPVAPSSTDFAPTSTVTTSGDVNGDGYPDVFTIPDNNGYLWQWRGQAPTPDGAALGSRWAIGGPDWNTRAPTTPPALRWKLDKNNDGPGSAIKDTSGNNRTGTFTGNPAWITGPDGTHAAAFNGTNAAINTTGPVLDTSKSLTVAAWVKMNATGTYMNVIGQDGNHSSGFYLQYRPEPNHWVFAMHTADAVNPPNHAAVATGPATVNAWTHLAGVYDAAAGQLRLYVNGVLNGTTAHTNAFNTTGPLIVGRGKYNGLPNDYFNGAIADVRVYDRPLPTAEITTIVTSQRPTA